MQVSWIEPDDLRSLLGRLQQPAAPVKAATLELHTLPDENGLGARELGIDDGDLWLPDDFAAPAAATNESAPPAAPSEELFSEALAALANEQTTVQTVAIEPLATTKDEANEPAAGDESAPPTALAPEQGQQLDRIRARLQAIRERALEAGLIGQARASPEESAASAPPPASEPALQPQAVAEMAAPPSVAAGEVSRPPVEPTLRTDGPPASLQERLKPIESPFTLDQTASEAVPPPTDALSPMEVEAAFQRPAGSLTDRLDAFAAWAGAHFQAGNLLIVDDHGDILWGDHAQAGLVVSAMMACKAMMRSSALGASGLATVIEQPISTDRLLLIVPCETTYGAVSIAFVRDRALTETDAALIRAALVSVVETAPSSPSPPQTGSAID